MWLARDGVLHKYVAVKTDLSNLRNELKILKHFPIAKSDHSGRIYSPVSLLLRHLWVDGPNGRHLALVLQVHGLSISRLIYSQIRLDACLARIKALQVTPGLKYLHSEGVCNGDLSS